MYLVVDAGNSYVKAAIFEGEKLVFRSTASYDLLTPLVEEVLRIGYDKGILISVVYELNDYLKSLFPKSQILLPSELKFPSRYSKATLGPDRLAAAYPFILRKESAIVVVCGSAITVNLVKDGVFLGGPIFPSFSTIKRAYSHLSMLSEKLHRDSLRAIEEGERYAITGGVREVIRYMTRKYGIKRKYITGGCANLLKVDGKLIPDLVLIGGNLILGELSNPGRKKRP